VSPAAGRFRDAAKPRYGSVGKFVDKTGQGSGELSGEPSSRDRVRGSADDRAD
jgi:hypothetical protein